MQAPPFPPNEQARLASLAELDLLDTPAESAFDHLTVLAASLVGVPIALITFVDAHRQWFKSSYGLDIQETPREIAFCAHVVAQEKPLIVADALADQRFADNPLVTGAPHIRFYAGFPLRTADGFTLGSLCAIDHRPRTLTPEQEHTLTALAAQVVALLELRRSQQRLRAQSQKLLAYGRFFDLSLELFCTVNQAGYFVELNPAWTTAVGWTLEELRARPFEDFLHPDDIAATREIAGLLLTESSSASQFENRYRHRDGHWVPLSWSGRAENGVIFATARDLTEVWARRAELARRETQLRESVAQLRTTFDAMDEGVLLQLADGAVAASNAAARAILGFDENAMLGRTPLEPRWRVVREDGSVFPPEERPALNALRTGQPQTDVLMGMQKPDGEPGWFAVNARPLWRADEASPYGVVSTVRDVTESRKSAERALHFAKQERLVAMGSLAAGVGHEVNNPLSYVLSNLELAIEELRQQQASLSSLDIKDVLEMLGEAKSGAENVKRIVRGLRALARHDEVCVATDVADAAEAAVNMTMHELRAKASVSLELPQLPQVSSNESRLTQVLVNLLVNAAQAFTSNDPSNNRVILRAVAGSDSVSIFVIDNGPGIAADVLPRIFDPLFTTRPVGRGTGLGLSVCHSIITALKGQLTCISMPGEGASFEVRLPLADAPPTQARDAKVNASPRRGRVLIIDDNESVLKGQMRTLTKHHDVFGEHDPREALRRLARGERFDVIFCDLMMPYLAGPDLFQRALAVAPEQASRFVFITGGVTQPGFEDFLATVPNQWLEKPVGLKVFRDVVRRALGGD